MAADDLIARDAVIRQAAFDHIRALQTGDLILSHELIQEGFLFEGQRWPLWNPQRGIFKPRGLRFLLSIRTVFPRKGAHIMADAHELLGQPVLPNGIALSKIHHAAFDSHLIGIDPDGRVYVSERLLMLHDGLLLEQSLKAIARTQIRPPRRHVVRPDRDRLAVRFEQFKRVA